MHESNHRNVTLILLLAKFCICLAHVWYQLRPAGLRAYVQAYGPTVLFLVISRSTKEVFLHLLLKYYWYTLIRRLYALVHVSDDDCWGFWVALAADSVRSSQPFAIDQSIGLLARSEQTKHTWPHKSIDPINQLPNHIL